MCRQGKNVYLKTVISVPMVEKELGTGAAGCRCGNAGAAAGAAGEPDDSFVKAVAPGAIGLFLLIRLLRR